MRIFSRIHHTQTHAIVSEHRGEWMVQICFRQGSGHGSSFTIAGLLAPTIEEAQELAEKEVLIHGHTCNSLCEPWVEL